MPPVIDIHGHTIPRRAYLRPDGKVSRAAYDKIMGANAVRLLRLDT